MQRLAHAYPNSQMILVSILFNTLFQQRGKKLHGFFQLSTNQFFLVIYRHFLHFDNLGKTFEDLSLLFVENDVWSRPIVVSKFKVAISNGIKTAKVRQIAHGSKSLGIHL